MLDDFLRGSFKFGKFFSVILLITLIGVTILSGFNLIKFSTNDFKIPEYNASLDLVRGAEKNKRSLKDEEVQQEVKEKYNDRIKKIVSDLQLSSGSDKVIENVFVVFKVNPKYEDYSEKLIFGFENFLRISHKATFDSKKPNIKIEKQWLGEIIEIYGKAIDFEISKFEMKKASQRMNKLISLGIIIFSIFLFLQCLFLPLLIKIEENTRK